MSTNFPQTFFIVNNYHFINAVFSFNNFIKVLRSKISIIPVVEGQGSGKRRENDLRTG